MDTTDYSSALACTIGASASFQVVRYAAQVTALVRPGIGHYADQLRLDLEGQVQGSSASDLGAKLTALGAAMKDGQNVIVTGLGAATEFSCVAARCFDGGPFLDLEIAPDQPAPLVKSVRLIVKTDQLPSGNNQGAYNYRVETQTRGDGLRVVSWDGQSTSPLGSTYLNATVIPAFKAAYAPPAFSIQLDYRTAQEGVISTIGFRFTASEYFAPLPAPGGGKPAAEGSIEQRIERDEHFRKLTTWEVDLLLDRGSDASAVLTDLRSSILSGDSPGSGGAAGSTSGGSTSGTQETIVILRESASIQTLRENRIRASFTLLASAGADAVMNWRRTIKATYPDQPAEMLTYIGADPILVQQPKRLGQVTDSGSAIAADQWVKAPDELFASQPHVHAPEVNYEYLNEAEKQTEWHRAYWVTADSGGGAASTILDTLTPDQLERAADNQFFSPPKPVQPGG